MGYESAPATKLLATHCCVCGRPLVEADSVESGIGPTCAKRTGYGYPTGTPDVDAARALIDGLGLVVDFTDPHKAANKLVYLASANVDNLTVARVLARAVKALGYIVLGDTLITRFAPATVTVHRNGTELVVTTEVKGFGTPLFDTLVTALRRVPGRRWVGEEKATHYPMGSKRALWEALKAALPAGSVVVGDTTTTVL